MEENPEFKTGEERRLLMLLETAYECDISLTLIAFLSADFSEEETAKLCGNIRLLPHKVRSLVAF